MKNDLTAFPKYAACAIPQKRPTSTTPVSILMRVNNASGFFNCSSGKGASMTKLPLSVTTGPAFTFAIRNEALGEPMR